MDDVFVPVPGFEGIYSINKHGEVLSLARIIECSNGKRFKVKTRYLTPHPGSNGYLLINFYENGIQTTHLVHRLVAQAFIPNPKGLPEVNHKDENIRNNHMSNLEWCTSKYNANYGTRNKRFGETKRQRGRAVVQFTKNGEFVREHKSMADASDSVGGDASLIIRVAKHMPRSNTAYGYIWRYRDELLPVKIV